MRTLVDANVLLRYLLHDDAELCEKAVGVIREGAFVFAGWLSPVLRRQSCDIRSQAQSLACSIV